MVMHFLRMGFFPSMGGIFLSDAKRLGLSTRSVGGISERRKALIKLFRIPLIHQIYYLLNGYAFSTYGVGLRFKSFKLRYFSYYMFIIFHFFPLLYTTLFFLLGSTFFKYFFLFIHTKYILTPSK